MGTPADASKADRSNVVQAWQAERKGEQRAEDAAKLAAHSRPRRGAEDERRGSDEVEGDFLVAERKFRRAGRLRRPALRCYHSNHGFGSP